MPLMCTCSIIEKKHVHLAYFKFYELDFQDLQWMQAKTYHEANSCTSHREHEITRGGKTFMYQKTEFSSPEKKHAKVSITSNIWTLLT